MLYLIGAQLPPALARWLRDRGFKAVSAREAGLRDSSDGEIWGWAVREGAAILTKDEDFSLLAVTARERCPVVWVRIGNVTNRALFQIMERRWADVVALVDAGERIVELR